MTGEVVRAAYVRPRWLSQPFFIATDRVEAVKWLAVLLMLVEHFDRYVVQPVDMHGRWTYALGRLVFPLFALCLGRGIASGGLGAAERAWRRLLFWGVAAQIAAAPVLGFGYFNVLFTMALGVALLLVERSTAPAVARVFCAVAVLVAATFVEFYAFGVLLVYAACRWSRVPSTANFAALLVALIALVLVNGNFVAVGALGVLWLLALAPFEVRRVRHLFYAVYALQFPVFLCARVLS